jgi:subtilase family serine protease
MTRVAAAIALACGGLACTPAALAATAPGNQVRISPDTRVQDLGLAPANDVKTITLALSADVAGMQAQAAALVDPTNPSYHHFLSPAQFAAAYGQSDANIAAVTAYLQSQGIVVTRVHPNRLLISAQATNAQVQAAFGTAIHAYLDAGVAYQAPASSPVIPAALQGVVAAVSGLNTKPLLQSSVSRIPNSGPAAAEASYGSPTLPSPHAAATGSPGWYTTADLAAQYNVTPLYQHGLTGTGRTIGIATLAGYNQSDAYAYWASLGLSVDPSRITDVNVDGGYAPGDGPGSPGAGETTLDVEQSGGVAPGAKIRVYVAPNTDAGFLDVFSQAVNENLVDTLSISWGGIEIGYDTATLNAFHTVFLQAALQGIPVIAAAGDAGAYDINRNPGPFTYPNQCTTLLTVDFPAADPYVLAAGGTTLPGVQHHKHGDVTVPAERPWGWDYLRNYALTYYGQSVYYSSFFPVGGGGGVSVMFARPSYQANLSGALNSAGAQSLYCSPAVTQTNSWQDWADLPAGYTGRNLPDIALDADPYTGYSVFQDGQWYGGSGGTSFVAPQLNGIFTLIAQGAGGRLGWLQPQLYTAYRTAGYGANSPFRAITTGTNLYYQAGSHYNPAAGLGALNVQALASALGALPSQANLAKSR